ncbi:melibiose operon regulatory protein, partial [Yokenella regensburgei ATCC 49455]
MMKENATPPLPPDPHMCSSDEKQTRSPLTLYSEYQRMDIELRQPHAMSASHWHGQ